MINKQIVSIKYITVFQCTYYILHCFLYPFILCIFWTTDQKVTGLNPVGVTLIIKHLQRIFCKCLLLCKTFVKHLANKDVFSSNKKGLFG